MVSDSLTVSSFLQLNQSPLACLTGGFYGIAS